MIEIYGKKIFKDLGALHDSAKYDPKLFNAFYKEVFRKEMDQFLERQGIDKKSFSVDVVMSKKQKKLYKLFNKSRLFFHPFRKKFFIYWISGFDSIRLFELSAEEIELALNSSYKNKGWLEAIYGRYSQMINFLII